MTNNLTNGKPFALYKTYTDGSGQPVMIYIGSDKAEAFDALMAFAKKDYFDVYQLRVEQTSEYTLKEEK